MSKAWSFLTMALCAVSTPSCRSTACLIQPCTSWRRQLVQGWIRQAVLLQEGVETAQRAIVRKLHAFDIVGNRLELASASADVRGWCKEKLGLWVDESRDQPRAGDSIDLRMLTSNPSHRSLGVA